MGMHKSPALLAGVLTFLTIVSPCRRSTAQDPLVTPTVRPDMNPEAAKALVAPERPDPMFLQVNPSPNLHEPMLTLHKGLASRLTNLKLPSNDWRNAHFRGLNKAGIPAHLGWQAMLIDVVPIEGGYLVWVRVTAKLDKAALGGYFLERYAMTAEGVRLIDIDTPPRMRGRFLIGL
jgi:hypothetical protein